MSDDLLSLLSTASVPDAIKYKPVDELRPLIQEHFVLSYCFLAAGLLVALVAFIYEIIKNRIEETKIKKSVKDKINDSQTETSTTK